MTTGSDGFELLDAGIMLVIPNSMPISNIDDRVDSIDNLVNVLFYIISCVVGLLNMHFFHSDIDNNICLLN